VFVEEARWLRAALERLQLPDGAAVANIGSSTEHFRTVEQPHIEREVLAPLRARGGEIVHVDMKEDEGVNLAVDLNAPGLDLAAALGREFDLVLATGLLEHFERPETVCALVRACVAPAGWLVVTTPQSYRHTPDPVDFGYRPDPAELADDVIGGDSRFAVVDSASVRIDDPRYYKGVVSRASVTKLGGRLVPLPGASERLRLRVPRWRWRESCVVVRRQPPA
jgi:hypothetical protein